MPILSTNLFHAPIEVKLERVAHSGTYVGGIVQTGAGAMASTGIPTMEVVAGGTGSGVKGTLCVLETFAYPAYWTNGRETGFIEPTTYDVGTSAEPW
jgi:hypothetical protein